MFLRTKVWNLNAKVDYLLSLDDVAAAWQGSREGEVVIEFKDRTTRTIVSHSIDQIQAILTSRHNRLGAYVLIGQMIINGVAHMRTFASSDNHHLLQSLIGDLTDNDLGIRPMIVSSKSWTPVDPLDVT